METKDSQRTQDKLRHDGGVVYTSLTEDRSTLIIHAVFDFPITVDPQPIIKKGKIKLRKGGNIPTRLLYFEYTTDQGTEREIRIEYPISDDDWDFITVRFFDSAKQQGNGLKGIRTHVKGSTVHYGDADEDKS